MARLKTFSHSWLRMAFCAGMFGFAGPAQAAALGGDAVNNLIIDALAAQNLTGNPAISAERVFPDCAEKLTIEPMFGAGPRWPSNAMSEWDGQSPSAPI